jgi:(1->4)-alpha-D-glucan 1-alpha-D-glucosylmutase
MARSETTQLERLGALYGIASEYYDAAGVLHRVPEESLRQLLAAMGAVADSRENVEREIGKAEDHAWRRRLPPVVIGREGDAGLRLSVTTPHGEWPMTWRLAEDSGRISEGALDPAHLDVQERREVDRETWIRADIALPAPAETGYHRLHLYRDATPQEPLAESLVIFAPARCYRPEPLEREQRLWGLTAQLYGLRSQRNWGIGDFTDLMRLVEFAADNGAAFVGLNPLHAPLAWDDAHASPYDPSSRLFLNALYLDVEAIPDFAESGAAKERVGDEGFQAALRSLRAAELVDYAAVAEAKLEVLAMLFDGFCRRHRDRGSERARDFAAFREQRGDALYRYAAFQVLYEHWRREDAGAWGWPAWPPAYRDGGSDAVAEFLASRNQRLEFFMYLQWNADAQLRATAERARELGMPVGIYADLALSSKHGGADTWIDRGLYMGNAKLGAPPDSFNQAGQDWGLPPWNPARLREAAYRPFIEMLRANMRIGGALRIDHVMSLLRCFLIPAGSTAADGAYVSYPFDELRAILALESARNRCLVIGEDLGTVPDEVRHGLGEIGVLGYRVLYFEKDAEGAYKLPAEYDPDVLSVISTHDLPTLAGFWHGADIEWRSTHGLYPGAEAREQQIVSRAQDRARLMMALEKESLLPEEADAELPAGTEMTTALRAAFHRYLARSASRLVGVQVEDLLGEREQANLPGTTDEHPNWRRRLSLQLEAWQAESQVETVLAAVREERPTPDERAPQARAAPEANRAVIPRATYRVQLHKNFGFRDAEKLLPYLDALGISHLYCSPYFKARPGSVHGYDVVDHSALNPELGDRAAFDSLCTALESRGMSHILDMVPNHMAVTGRDHVWWLDVLENGPASRYAEYFDIDWQPLKEELRGKVLLPVLGDHYGNLLDEGELELVFDAAKGSFAVEYYEHRFPIDPREYPRVLEPELEALRSRLSEDDPSLVLFESLITAFGNLPPRSAVDEDSRRERARDKELHQRRLSIMAGDAPDIRRYIDDCLRVFNGDEQYPADVARLHQLLEAQPYRLAYWRVASHEINYRRFFDINDLASLRMENPEVFEATHRLVFELIAEGRLAGLRIDHPDGLYDPRGYFRTLQERVGGRAVTATEDLPLYLVAEKILAGDESLRDDWPVHGTTGYEFANLVNRFLVRTEGLAELDAAYTAFVGRPVTYDEILHRSKSLIMQTSLASELNVLTAELDRLAEQDPHTRDFGLGGLHSALLETVACFPVYRTYAVDGEISGADEAIINHAVDAAKRRSEAADTSVFEFLRDVLLNRSAAGRGEALTRRVASFGMRLQQYTSPVAAKGMEDTAFYRYGRLVSLNEVGGTPELPGASMEEFHQANLARRGRWPHSMLASSTHDAKRSEDVRARLHVLSEMPGEWRRQVERWSRINEPLKPSGSDAAGIDRDAEYFLYQTLLGAWPLEPVDESAALDELRERLTAYMTKAAKEAKRHTSWLNPDPDYEESLQRFTAALLDPGSNREFMQDFLPFQRRIARLGLYNGLSQLVLKLTCPGVPDTYQGTELWRLDLVDPDNRRPVDFTTRAAILEELARRYTTGEVRQLVQDLMYHMEDGRVKLFATWRALSVRREHPGLFEGGDYVPLAVRGDFASHVCAFARRAGGVTMVVAVARWFSDLVDEGGMLDATRLAGTSVELPSDRPDYIDSFTDRTVTTSSASGRTSALASDLFAAMPVTVCVNAGIRSPHPRRQPAA